jgi:hypothetical protein
LANIELKNFAGKHFLFVELKRVAGKFPLKVCNFIYIFPLKHRVASEEEFTGKIAGNFKNKESQCIKFLFHPLQSSELEI